MSELLHLELSRCPERHMVVRRRDAGECRQHSQAQDKLLEAMGDSSLIKMVADGCIMIYECLIAMHHITSS